MVLRLATSLFVLALFLAGGAVLAQNKVHTETIKPPNTSQPAANGQVAAPSPKAAGQPEIITDLSRLPPAVAEKRERILQAARTGDLQKLVAVMQAEKTLPVFSFADDKDPAASWKANYPDSDGIEVLSILVSILEAGFVHADAGTPQDVYLWPYFARMPLKALTPEQKVGLFRIVTGSDYKEMLEFGAYSFYRLGISPDGTWRFFVAGD
jgi:hypothetical protein